jgi:L-alanine-DL-glutamate epimerase-like enolase superfamily enzyme
MTDYILYAIAVVALPILGIVAYKLWLKYAPTAEAAAYADGVKVLQRLAKLNTPPTATEQAKAAAAQAHTDAMKLAFKTEADKLLA